MPNRPTTAATNASTAVVSISSSECARANAAMRLQLESKTKELDKTLLSAVTAAMLRSPEHAFGEDRDADFDDELLAVFTALVPDASGQVPFAKLASLITAATSESNCRCDESDVLSVCGSSAGGGGGLTFEQFAGEAGRRIRENMFAAADFAACTETEKCERLQHKIMESISSKSNQSGQKGTRRHADKDREEEDRGEDAANDKDNTNHQQGLAWFEVGFLKQAHIEDLMETPAWRTETSSFRQAPLFVSRTCVSGKRPPKLERRLPRSHEKSTMPAHRQRAPGCPTYPHFKYEENHTGGREDDDEILIERLGVKMI